MDEHDTDTTGALYGRKTYGELVLTALRRHPGRVAFLAGDRRISYAEAEGEILRMAGVLRQRGVGRGSGVAVLSKNRPEAWFATIAAMLAGARTSALHALGSLDDHRYICADGGIGTIVFDPGPYQAHVEALTAALEMEDVLALGPADGFADLTALAERAEAFDPRTVRVTEADVAALIYTGGTTGRPKGVVRPHRCLAEMVAMQLAEWPWPDRPRYLASAPLTHATGQMFVPVLMKGGTIVLHEGFDSSRWVETVEAEAVNCAFVVPTMLYRLLGEPGFHSGRLSSLQSVFYGAAPMSPDRLAEAIRAVGPVFVQFYAQAESTVMGTLLRAEEHDVARPERLSSCGRPLAGVRLELLDENDQPVEPGQVGQIALRGPFVMDGYWNQPEATAEALRNGWLHTGDLAVMDGDGYVTIVGREKDLIISGGFNLFAREIEDVLSSHPQVEAAAVVGVPDPLWGEKVLALVVARPGEAPSAPELQALVRGRKGPMHVPKDIELVAELPLTPLGKIDKKRIRAAHWSGEARQVH